MSPTFWQLARKPKWLGGLAIAALVAVVFSLLMQWQLSRTFNVVGVEPQENAPVAIEELVQPGPITQNVYDRMATVTTTIDPANSNIVANRLQLSDGETIAGYWLISNSQVGDKSLTLALGFSEDIASIREVQRQLKPIEYSLTGYLQPTEPPKPQQGGVLQSLSLAQLVNLYSAEEIVSYPVYMIVQEGFESRLQTISIDIRQQEIEVNWLTAFYAVEWAFFALAAFYIWWRLVRDEQIRLAEQH